MKIVMINSTYAPDIIGGAELSVQFLAETLADMGHDIVIVAMGKEARVDRQGKVRVYRIKLKNLYWPYERRRVAALRIGWNLLDIANPFMASAVRRILRAERPDVVHTNNLQGISSLVWKVAFGLDMPVVHTIRDLFLLCPKSAMFRNGRNCDRPCVSCSLFAAPKKGLSRYVSRVVGVSRFILDRHLEFGWFPNAEPSVIHNSYNSPEVCPEFSTSGPVRFGYLGRLDHRKGVALLLEAFATPEIASRSTLLMAGEGDPAFVEALKSKASGLPVTFGGRMSPSAFFAEIDVLVVPSIIHEALGRVIIEGYAFGRPAIGSSRGGIPEIIVPSLTGFLFHPDRSAFLQSYLARFIEHRSLAASMAGPCLEQFKQFMADTIAAQYADVFESIQSAASHFSAAEDEITISASTRRA